MTGLEPVVVEAGSYKALLTACKSLQMCLGLDRIVFPTVAEGRLSSAGCHLVDHDTAACDGILSTQSAC